MSDTDSSRFHDPGRASKAVDIVVREATAPLVAVPVPGADALMAMEADGSVWVALRPMCDTLGIDFATQVRKLRRRSWAGIGQRPTPSPGGVQQTTVITSETVPMWLATIDENRVSEEARPQLIAYQREARDVLDAHFNRRTAPAPAMNQLDVLRAALDQIEAAQRDATRAVAQAGQVLAGHVPFRLGRHGGEGQGVSRRVLAGRVSASPPKVSARR